MLTTKTMPILVVFVNLLTLHVHKHTQKYMLNQNLSQKQLQKLSPQQIQLMKLLQVPTAALEQRIEEELESNPALEEDKKEDDTEFEASSQDDAEETGSDEEFDSDGQEEVSIDDYLEDYLDDEDAIASYKLTASNYSPDEEEKNVPIAVEGSFHEYLEEQLGLLDLDEREYIIAAQIIGSIDDDGYLRRELFSISDDLAFSQNIRTDEREILGLLEEIQKFDPPGVGARNLQDCLLIQLRRRLEFDNDKPEDVVKLAMKIITKNFEEFTKKHYDKLQRQLSVDGDTLKDAVDIILHLNPKPASGYTPGFSRSKAQYIIPDFLVDNNGNGKLELNVNSKNAPDLRISDQYKDMLRTYVDNSNKSKQDKEAIMFIKQKIDAAKWFIDAIKQRQSTMFVTMQAIIDYQYEYFLSGDERQLRPMILKDIADKTGLDISTISRVANSKYVQTEFGTKRLKEFFSESLQTDSGEEVSTLEVKDILSELIQKESKKKPLSDEKLKEILTKRGYNIARRTVAKYREQLNIAVARLRKEL